MRLLLAAAAALALAGAVRADEDGMEETPPIQRYLVNLHLGDSLKEVREIYPPTQEWPMSVEPRGKVTRYHVERGYAKRFPDGAQTLWLGFKSGDLVDIQVVYDQQRTREKPAETLAADVSLTYGEARRTDERFWWSDGKTVMRVFPARVQALREGKVVTEERTSIQVAERGLFKRID